SVRQIAPSVLNRLARLACGLCTNRCLGGIEVPERLMSAKTTVRTRCPECRRKYEVPATSVGHRARCPNCHTVFRIPVPQKPAAPTEDDILAWLTEGEPESDVV